MASGHRTRNLAPARSAGSPALMRVKKEVREMKWQKKLTKKEMTHLKKDAGCDTLAQFRENRDGQRLLDPTKEVCFECRRIAIKLGGEK